MRAIRGRRASASIEDSDYSESVAARRAMLPQLGWRPTVVEFDAAATPNGGPLSFSAQGSRDDTVVVGRTNLIILCLGFFACVSLSLMMKHVVQVEDKERVHPAVMELQALFAEQMKGSPTLVVTQRGGRAVAVLTVTPSVLVSPDRVPRLALTLGRYVSRFRGEDLMFDALVVVAKSTTGGPDRTIEIPQRTRKSLRTGFRSRRKLPAKAPTKAPAKALPTVQPKPSVQPKPPKRAP
jgi:hypothetical protein